MTSGRHAPIVRTLERLVLFGVARVEWDTYALRRTIPPLGPRQQSRLPGYLAVCHDADVQRMRHDDHATVAIGLTR